MIRESHTLIIYQVITLYKDQIHLQ